MVHPEVKNWVKYAKFEEKNHYVNSCRRIYERSVEFFFLFYISETLLLSFAKFEEGQKEVSESYDLSYHIFCYCHFSSENHILVCILQV